MHPGGAAFANLAWWIAPLATITWRGRNAGLVIPIRASKPDGPDGSSSNRLKTGSAGEDCAAYSRPRPRAHLKMASDSWGAARHRRCRGLPQAFAIRGMRTRALPGCEKPDPIGVFGARAEARRSAPRCFFRIKVRNTASYLSKACSCRPPALASSPAKTYAEIIARADPWPASQRNTKSGIPYKGYASLRPAFHPDLADPIEVKFVYSIQAVQNARTFPLSIVISFAQHRSCCSIAPGRVSLSVVNTNKNSVRSSCNVKRPSMRPGIPYIR